MPEFGVVLVLPSSTMNMQTRSTSPVVGAFAWKRLACLVIPLLTGIELVRSFEIVLPFRHHRDNDLLAAVLRGGSPIAGAQSSKRSVRDVPRGLVRQFLWINADDSADRAEPLPLTAQDLRRLQTLKARHTTMPIMILDAMLPRQKLTFKSDDPKFHRLVQYCLEEERHELCMIGLNPHTGRPISRGVTLAVTPDTLQRDGTVLTWQAMAQHRVEVQGEPWMDDTESFYLADVELMGTDQPASPQSLSDEQHLEVQRMSKALPKKLREWMVWVLQVGATDQAGMDMRLADLGPIPKDPTDRAFWAAALVNPIPALGVCLEIRPALLSCSNDLDRMILTTQAIQSSIDHLSGKHRLF